MILQTVLQNIAEVYQAALAGQVFFRYIWVLWLIIPIALVYILVINKDFVQLDKDKHKRKIAKRGRFFLVVSRVLISFLVLVALASPYMLIEERTEGEPRLVILIDNSSSMGLFDIGFTDGMKQRFSESIPTTIKSIGFQESSRISEGVFANMDAGNLVLVTDGNNYEGKDLHNTLLLAMSRNVSVSWMEMAPYRNEISVTIEGPSKVVEGVENDYIVRINYVGTDDANLKISFDDDVEIEEVTREKEILIKKKFTTGEHKMVAEVSGEDTFQNNNIFYKTIEVIEKPRILMLSKARGPLAVLLEKLYNLEIVQNLPTDLSPYLSIIVNDMSADELSEATIDRLREYTNLGDGLLFVGGENSFDFGRYQGSYVETLLPAKVGKGRELPSKDVSVVMLLDKSMSTKSRVGSGELGVNLEKEIAINIIDQIEESNYVGVIAFNEEAEVISPLVPKSEAGSIKQKITDIRPWGATNMHDAIIEAISMLKGREGSRNIIIISDGKDRNINTYLGKIRESAKLGIVTHTVNIGKDSDKITMEEIAKIGNGNFFSPENSEGVSVVFEKPEDEWPLMILPKNHFITDGIKLSSFVTGYNQIVPKSSGQLLATTVFGDPLLVVGRYGLGRIAVLATDDGTSWAGSVLTKDPKFISKILNWAIENPQRKNDFYTDVSDTRIGEDVEAYVKTYSAPEDGRFSKIDENIYKAEFSAKETGFYDIMGEAYGVNYHEEFEHIGLNQEFVDSLYYMGANIHKPYEEQKIIDVAKGSSFEIVSRTKSLRNYLIFPAIVILLSEIIVRRVFRYRKIYK